MRNVKTFSYSLETLHWAEAELFNIGVHEEWQWVRSVVVNTFGQHVKSPSLRPHGEPDPWEGCVRIHLLLWPLISKINFPVDGDDSDFGASDASSEELQIWEHVSLILLPWRINMDNVLMWTYSWVTMCFFHPPELTQEQLRFKYLKMNY